jgi:hypothetical protein
MCAMNDSLEYFDPSPFEVRESEVLAVLSQHIAALCPQQLLCLKDKGAVLMNLDALEAGDNFGLHDLTIAFVEPWESVADVELRVGKVWISTFSWLNEVDTFDALHEPLSGGLCHQTVLMQAMSYNWFELVLWAAEERWISGSGP